MKHSIRHFISRNNIPAHYFRSRRNPNIMALHLLKPGCKFQVVEEWKDTGVPFDGVWEKVRGTTAVNTETGEKAIFSCLDIVEKV